MPRTPQPLEGHADASDSQAQGTLVKLPVGEDAALLASLLAANASAPNGSSSWAGTRTAPTSAASSAPPTSSPNAATNGVATIRELTGGDGAHAVRKASAPPRLRHVLRRRPRRRPSSAGSAPPSTRQVHSALAPSCATSPLPAVSPPRAHIEQLLPDVLDGRIQPGQLFDRTVGLNNVPDGYRAMADREALKVLSSLEFHHLVRSDRRVRRGRRTGHLATAGPGRQSDGARHLVTTARVRTMLGVQHADHL